MGELRLPLAPGQMLIVVRVHLNTLDEAVQGLAIRALEKNLENIVFFRSLIGAQLSTDIQLEVLKEASE